MILESYARYFKSEITVIKVSWEVPHTPIKEMRDFDQTMGGIILDVDMNKEFTKMTVLIPTSLTGQDQVIDNIVTALTKFKLVTGGVGAGGNIQNDNLARLLFRLAAKSPSFNFACWATEDDPSEVYMLYTGLTPAA